MKEVIGGGGDVIEGDDEGDDIEAGDVAPVVPGDANAVIDAVKDNKLLAIEAGENLTTES